MSRPAFTVFIRTWYPKGPRRVIGYACTIRGARQMCKAWTLNHTFTDLEVSQGLAAEFTTKKVPVS